MSIHGVVGGNFHYIDGCFVHFIYVEAIEGVQCIDCFSALCIYSYGRFLFELLLQPDFGLQLVDPLTCMVDIEAMEVNNY
jgi:hypothetical protein